jgi:LemA protein
MEIVTTFIFVIVILCIILIWYINTFNQFQNFIVRINEAEANIDSILRKRYDLLKKSIGVIKSNTDEENVLDDLADLRSQKLSNFDLDRKIYDAISEFNKYKEEHRDLKKCEGFMKIELSINETEAEIEALRKYYNDIITDYNKMIKSVPSNIVSVICKFKNKTYFDGKDLNKSKNEIRL